MKDEDFIEINRAASEQGVGVIAAGNFAITAVLLQRFACEAAKYLSHWEIIDYASWKSKMVTVAKVQNGQLVEETLYFDNLSVMKQLGLA